MRIQSPNLRRVLRDTARIATVGSALAFVALSMELPTPLLRSAHAAGTNAGIATVVDPATGVLLSAGTKDTDFTLRLPTGAACSGDSANDGFRVQSFHIVGSANPADLTYNDSGPIPNDFGAAFRQPLYQLNTTPFIDGQTAPANPAPGPGPVTNVPAFDFSQYNAQLLPAGTYNIGISCTRPGGPSATQHDKFWNVVFTIAGDQSWTVTQSSTTSTTAGATPTSTPASTSTTQGSGSSTTSSTTTSTSTTSTTVRSSTSTTAASATTVTTSSAGSTVNSGTLARAGSDNLPIAFAGVLVLIFGRMAILLGRPTTKGAPR